MSRIHILKNDHFPFQASWDEAKTSEVRVNDRNYQVGDGLMLCEMATPSWEPVHGEYSLTGRVIRSRITHIQSGYGLPKDVVVLSLADITKDNMPAEVIRELLSKPPTMHLSETAELTLTLREVQYLLDCMARDPRCLPSTYDLIQKLKTVKAQCVPGKAT